MLAGMVGCGGGGSTATSDETETATDDETTTDEDSGTGDDEDTSDDEGTSDDEEDTGSEDSAVEVWNIDTGYNSADLEENYTFEAIVINLDTQAVSSLSSDFVVVTDDDGSYNVTLDGETVVTVSEDVYGITID